MKYKQAEINQLFHAANNFVGLGKNCISGIDKRQLLMKTKEVSKGFENGRPSQKDGRLSILLSYLSSAAIRISTIYEAFGIKPNNKVLYSNNLNLDNIHFFLRECAMKNQMKIQRKCLKKDGLLLKNFKLNGFIMPS